MGAGRASGRPAPVEPGERRGDGGHVGRGQGQFAVQGVAGRQGDGLGDRVVAAQPGCELGNRDDVGDVEAGDHGVDADPRPPGAGPGAGQGGDTADDLCPAVLAVAGRAPPVVVSGIGGVQRHRDRIRARVHQGAGDLGPVQRDPVRADHHLHAGGLDHADQVQDRGPAQRLAAGEEHPAHRGSRHRRGERQDLRRGQVGARQVGQLACPDIGPDTVFFDRAEVAVPAAQVARAAQRPQHHRAGSSHRDLPGPAGTWTCAAAARHASVIARMHACSSSARRSRTMTASGRRAAIRS